MGVKIVDRNAQQEVEVDPASAQEALMRGDAALTDETVVVKRGTSTGTVSSADLPTALAEGWALSDEEERASLTMQREESDFASSALGAGEALLAGASLGLSSSAAEALGADPERMAARREGLGTLSTGLELAGAVVPAAFTGGGSIAGTAGGAAARGGIRGALRYSPAGLLEGGAAALERRAGAALAESSGLVRTVVPVAGRGAVEGFVSGAGAQLHEDVLGQRDIALDRLLGAGGMGAILGGGGGALVGGVSGAALTGAKLSREAAGQVLNRASGYVDDLASGQSHILERALADGNAPRIAKLLGIPEESVSPLLPSLRAAAKGDTELDDLLQAGGSQRFEEDLATTARPAVEDLLESVGTLRQVMGRRGKARTINAKIDPEKIEAAARGGMQQIDDFRMSIDAALAKNAEFGGELYDKGTLAQLKKLADRAAKQVEEAQPKWDRMSPRPAIDPDKVARTAYQALDELKQDADQIIAKVRTSVQRSGSVADSNTLDAIVGAGENAGPLTAVRRHLEDEQLYGALGTAQREMNSASRAAIASRRDLADGATKRLLDGRRGFLDNRDLLSLVKSSGRFKGEQITENFREVIRREIEAAEVVAKHGALDAEQAAALAKARQTEKTLDDVFAKQRDKVQKLDAVEMWRNAEGNRSVSIGAMSSPMNVIAPLLGGAAFGPVGAAVGYAASLASKPYTLLRKYTAIQRQINKGEKGQVAAVAAFVKNLGRGAAKAARATTPYAYGTGRAVRAAATRGSAMSQTKIRERNDAALERAQYYARNPGALAEDMRGSTINMEDVAPSMSGAALQQAAAASAFLVSKAPTRWEDPLGRVSLVDKTSQARFDRYAEAVLDPLASLARLGSGTFSLEHAEALKTIYPTMYYDVQKRVMAAMIDAKKIPFRERVQAGVLFESPTDASMRPEMIAATQAAIGDATAKSEEPQQPQVRASGAPSPKSTAAFTTGAGRIESGASRLI